MGPAGSGVCISGAPEAGGVWGLLAAQPRTDSSSDFSLRARAAGCCSRFSWAAGGVIFLERRPTEGTCSPRGPTEGEQRGPAALTCGPWGRLPAEGLGQCPAPGFSLSRSPKTSGNFGVTPPDPQRSSTSARNIAQGTEILQRGGLMQCTPPVQRPAPGHAWAPTGTRVHGGGVGEGALGTSCGQGSCHYLAAVNTARSAPSCPCLICFANKYSWDIETLASDYCFEL